MIAMWSASAHRLLSLSKELDAIRGLAGILEISSKKHLNVLILQGIRLQEV